MNSLDAHGLLKSALLRGRYGAKKSGKAIAFRCTRHNDSTSSAWLGDHAWGCAACGFTEPLATLGEALGVTLPDDAAPSGLTLHEYAERKGLSLAGLAKAGVEERTGKFGDAIILLAITFRKVVGDLFLHQPRSLAMQCPQPLDLCGLLLPLCRYCCGSVGVGPLPHLLDCGLKAIPANPI
jgi:hypothetical protein